MKLDLQSLFGLMGTVVLITWDPATPSLPPPHSGSYTRALLVSQDRRHLFVNPWKTAYALVIRSPWRQVPNSGAQEVDRAVAAARAAFPAWAARSGKLTISCLHHISWFQIFQSLLQICNSVLSHVNQLFVLSYTVVDPDSKGSLDPYPGGQKWPTKIGKS